MAPAPRPLLRLAAALAVPAAGEAAISGQALASMPGARDGALARAVATVLVAGLAVAAYASLLSAVERGRGQRATEAERAGAAEAAARLPGRLAWLVLLLGSLAIGTATALRLLRGMQADVALAQASVAAAFSLMAAMLAHAESSAHAAGALTELGPAELGHTGGMRGRVLLVAGGLLGFGILLSGPIAYSRFRADMDLHHLAHAASALVQAARLAGERGADEAVEYAFLASGAPTALLGEDGAVRAQAGSLPPGLLREAPGALRGRSAHGAPAEPFPGGWRLRRALPDGELVAFLSEEPLLARRRGFWEASGLMGLVVLAATSLLVWLVAGSLTEPLRLLREATDRVAGGDLTAGPVSFTQDEIGQLASDFRRMTAGLKGLVQEIQEGSRSVLEGTREMNFIGAEVRAGAAEERSQVSGVQEATLAMQGAVAQAGRGVEGLSVRLAATSGAVERMTRALEEVRRQAAELARLGEAAGRDVEKLTQVGQRAERQLLALEELAGHSGETLAAVSGSLESLERSTVASQLAAAQAAELADHAGEVVREAASGIDGVRAAVGDAKRRVAVLGRRSDDIDQIVTFINDVAGRTNLLSLNASIIATQAGEHGKGFAVVAEQIRELAAQISSSTRSIGEIIRAVRDDVEGTAALIDRGDALAAGGVALAQKSLGALDEIRIATGKGHETAAAIQESLAAHGAATRQVADLVASVAQNSRALAEAVQVVGRSVAGVGSVNRGLDGLVDRVAAALTEQSELGRQQLGALDRTNANLREFSGAMERHARAERSVRDALDRLVEALARREAAAEALGGVADRLGRRSRALAERTARFKVG